MSELPQHYSTSRPEKETVDLPKWPKLPVYLEFSDQKSPEGILYCLHYHNIDPFILLQRIPERAVLRLRNALLVVHGR